MILILMFGGLTLFMLTGLPIAFVLGGLSLIFTVTLWNPGAVIVLVLQIYDTMKSEALLAIPLFILMACILQRSGVIEELYRAMEIWFGRVRGGLAIGTVIICVIMAAMTGVVGAAVTAMGILALPEMLRRGYKPELALGTICASGTLGILIPPSVLTIVYAVTAQVSIGQMLIAGIVPGIVLALLYISYIVVVSWLKPEWVPLDTSQPRASFREKLVALKSLAFPSLLIVMILGSIFFGIATPTESAAVGVAGAIVPAVLRRRLNFELLRSAGVDALKATSMILWITLGAKAYVAIFTGLGGADTLLHFIQNLEVNRWVVLAMMMLLLVFLGTVLDELGIILLTVPVFLPIVRMLGFDEIWFGVLYAITIQMGYISPPFGYTLFYIKGTLPPHITMGAVYKGILPFFLLQFVGLLLCALLPDLVTFLPRMMSGH
ncbi:TRAP transporter large permease subunit [Comamonas aquatica]|uniref:TRAP transporter large permease protein n=1 Tax=Comamonas aquatica TaxID=225991 RepID=A0AA42W5V3_9BURK|nr:TRAP transporter large permease subunit [Comamonas aquatica]MDH0202569.1 TRAP transporter large permease subunit [Comamonas aquatica]MDH0373285.1 TRAP transporter large permease subunit [Comamonas aquatica]MDH0383266.1 TRAP transporter large permease subunit [Comamonas aquatica]MDH0431284.1 TRAP transporter large permease subunit [Comamonas aquatica]MDH0942381.1 TRAP transporter large permease subunit [Comamonas aquatica]